MRSSDELDLDIRREPAPLNLAADLLWDRLTRARFAAAKVVPRRDVGRHRLPDHPRVTVESWGRGDRAIVRDKPYLPLVGIRARLCPRHVARGCEQDRLLLVGIERARAAPDNKTRRLPVF